MERFSTHRPRAGTSAALPVALRTQALLRAPRIAR